MIIKKLKSEFSCLGCGSCCSTGVVVDLVEAVKIVGKYGGEFSHLQRNKTFPSGFSVETSYKDGPCVFLKKNRCRVYKDRPFYCREFPLEDFKVSQEVDLCPQLDKKGRLRK